MGKTARLTFVSGAALTLALSAAGMAVAQDPTLPIPYDETRGVYSFSAGLE